MQTEKQKCFACDKTLMKSRRLVDTRDGQTVCVGSECLALIKPVGEAGYQPPKGGPRLWLIPDYEVISAGVENDGWYKYRVRNLLMGRKSKKSKKQMAQ